MILSTSTLWRAGFHHLRCNRRERSAGPFRWCLPRARSRSVKPNVRSPLIDSHRTIDSLLTNGGEAGLPFLVRRSLKTLAVESGALDAPIWADPTHSDASWRLKPLQTSYFSTEGESTQSQARVELLVDLSKELPEIYASPTKLITNLDVVPLESGCKSLVINGDEWHTAAYIHMRTKECFHSGKLSGKFMNTNGKNDQWEMALISSLETRVVEGKVYYRSEDMAKEAAAARALDCIAFRCKFGYSRRMFLSVLEPLRYCVELPSLYSMSLGKSATITNSDVRHRHAPAHYWSCLMQAKYGPIEVNFDVQSASFRSERSSGNIHIEEAWYSATCTEPKTGETFHSGVFESIIPKSSYMPDAPKTPLALEDCRIVDGMVYYRDDITAKHAAAARAIDCFYFRKYLTTTKRLKKISQLCLEEPYLAPFKKQIMASTNYKELKAIVENRRRGKSSISSFSDFFESRQIEAMKFPRKTLQKALNIKYEIFSSYSKILFHCVPLKNGDGAWYTSSFVDPVTREEFPSGLLRVPKSPSPHHFDRICSFNGKVYYAGAESAMNAAAARAIDCYNIRDKMPGNENNAIQLCYEDPYKTVQEGMQQSIDYETLLTQRDRHLSRTRSDFPAQDIPKAKFTFSDFVESDPHFLHSPKQFLYTTFKTVHGIEDSGSIFHFHVHEKDDHDQTWFTATFTDPITHETFSSGLVGEIKVDSRRDSSMSTPLHLVDAETFGGKVYYLEKRLAEHAAAARAIDCYLFREEKCNENFKLCIEDPYKTAEEGASQKIDYNYLIAQRSPGRLPRSFFAPLPKSFPHLLHVPKSFLHNAFHKIHGVACTPDTYHIQEKDHENQTWFTATFTDPITRETFSSGLGGEISVEPHPSAILATPLHLAGVKIFNGKVYYLERNLAKHAAAARAIDCYIFRKEKGNNVFKLCLEDPYKTAEEGASQKIDYNALIAQRSLLYPPPNCKDKVIPPMAQGTFLSLLESAPYRLHVPKSFLHNAFQKNYVPCTPDSYQTQEKDHENQTWFTTTFTDPITRETFSSGLGGEIKVEPHCDAMLPTPLHLAVTKILDEKVYYLDNRLAEHAAAARAIDCYIFREKDCNEGVRLCLEDPYKTVEEGASQKTDYDALIAQRSLFSSPQHGTS